MKRRLYLLKLLIIIMIFMMNNQLILGDTWYQGNSPQLSPDGMKVGNISATLGNNSGPFMIVKGTTLVLAASSSDSDSLYSTSTCSYSYPLDPNPMVNWEATGGGLSAARVSSGTSVTWTAPTTTGSYTITATPDDNTTSGNGDPLEGYGGTREDSPGSSSCILITVIEACPTSAALGTSCSVPTNVSFATGFASNTPNYMTFGYLKQGMVVSGGSPPGGSWNGLLLNESVSLNTTDTSATSEDLSGANLNNMCVGASTFVVGAASNSFSTCTFPATNNTLWDRHQTSSVTSIKKSSTSTDVVCDQTYTCSSTDLVTYKIKRKFTKAVWNKPPNTTVTEVGISKYAP